VINVAFDRSKLSKLGAICTTRLYVLGGRVDDAALPYRLDVTITSATNVISLQKIRPGSLKYQNNYNAKIGLKKKAG